MKEEAKPLITHLIELRRTVLICVAAFAAAFLIIFLFYSEQLMETIVEPLSLRGIQVIYTNVSEAFISQTKISIIMASVVSSPIVFVSLWMFVRPAFNKSERFILIRYFLAAAVLFVLGVFFAYRYVFFLAVNFFLGVGVGTAEPMLALEKYIDFLFGFLLPFGIVFELPVAVVLLTRLGIVTAEMLCKARKYVLFMIFLLAAILTPPDVISQVMLGVPMYALYEVGIISSRLCMSGQKEACRLGERGI